MSVVYKSYIFKTFLSFWNGFGNFSWRFFSIFYVTVKSLNFCFHYDCIVRYTPFEHSQNVIVIKLQYLTILSHRTGLVLPCGDNKKLHISEGRVIVSLLRFVYYFFSFRLTMNCNIHHKNHYREFILCIDRLKRTFTSIKLTSIQIKGTKRQVKCVIMRNDY